MPYNESYKRPENNRLCLNDETKEQELIDCGNDQVPLRNRARKVRVVQKHLCEHEAEQVDFFHVNELNSCFNTC